MKYMGSKARLAKDLAPIINKIIEQKQIDTYIEPFVGGANLIQHITCDNKIGYDKHLYLIELLNAIKNGYEPPSKISVEHYQEVKDSFKKQDGKYENYYYGAIGFLGAFRGLFFDSPGCEDYISGGRVRNNYVESRKNILNQYQDFQSIDFYCSDYREIKIPNNSLIYCDPPYQNTSQKGYADSNSFNHDEYWSWVRLNSKSNIVLCSEYNAPNDFVEIWQKEISTNLAVNHRKKDVEKLFIHESRYSDIEHIIKNQ